MISSKDYATLELLGDPVNSAVIADAIVESVEYSEIYENDDEAQADYNALCESIEETKSVDWQDVAIGMYRRGRAHEWLLRDSYNPLFENYVEECRHLAYSVGMKGEKKTVAVLNELYNRCRHIMSNMKCREITDDLMKAYRSIQQLNSVEMHMFMEMIENCEQMLQNINVEPAPQS